MDRIMICSYAKINLSIDVGAREENGYHAVDMIMQQLSFHDDVTIQYQPGKDRQIRVKTNRYYLPTDRRNLAYQAAELMAQRYGKEHPGSIEIHLKKRIPVAAGLAGGSGNGAAVIHGLNALWKLDLDLDQVCSLCAELGSDVPFSAMIQAHGNRDLPEKIRKHPLAVACARATGRGTELKPVHSCNRPVLIAKPNLSVSTAEVYRGIDECTVDARPDNDQLAKDLERGGHEIYRNFINVLECYTLKAYPEVAELKARMEKSNAEKVLMSGSGPTVFAMFRKIEDAMELCAGLRDEGYEAYWTWAAK